MIVLDFLQAAGRRVKALPRKIFGSRNDRIVKKLMRVADAVLARDGEAVRWTPSGELYDEVFAKRAAEAPRPAEGDAAAKEEYEKRLQAIRVELSLTLRERGEAIRARLRAGAAPQDVMVEAFAIVREASRRAQNHRHFHCQIIGGQALYNGCVAEMRTGEGKTIVCHLAAYLKVLQGLKVHIVTVNDYLVKRDGEFARSIFELLGVTVGYIQAQVDPGGREGWRAKQYACDLTYGTASEFGFDYLRDNMKSRLREQVQGRLDFAIIDEVDSILIDEARTPLIISGSAAGDVQRYSRANHVAIELVRRQDQWDRKVRATVARYDGDPRNIEKLGDAMNILGYGAKKLQRTELDEGEKEEDVRDLAALGPDFLTDDHVEAIQLWETEVLQTPAEERYRRLFITDRERKQAHLTHDGVTIAQEQLGIGSLYSGANMEWPHLIENALRAHKVYQRDRDFVVQEGKIIIVDPNTGRLMHGRQWSDGLHQAVEAAERVEVKEETQTLATITIQNFFKLYKSMAGMTGTAATEATEFMKIYNLDVVEIPTNRPVNRKDHNDKIYRSKDQKYRALVDEIHDVHRRGRPADMLLLSDALSALRPIRSKQGEEVGRIDEALKRVREAQEATPELKEFVCEVYDEAMADFVRGRPILVGTTSVEDSERLSRMLTRVYGIEHEVLNAKQHQREAEIVAKAGQQAIPARGEKRPVGNVTISTNMAGRGTDIKLALPVVHVPCRVPARLPEGAAASTLFPPGVTKCCIHCDEYDPATNCAHCFKPKIDPRFPELGRKVCPINVPCGLHIIGTERHESRRIDNQLRGRSGRQGDPGSSRFFLSVEDDLLKLFMGDWMLKMLEWVGFTEGESLEDKRLTKGIERAQKKVEERNFLIRKNLLEWDEPKDYQRKEFYKKRQGVLEGREISQSIEEMTRRTTERAVEQILGRRYPARCAAEWARTRLEVPISLDGVQLQDVGLAVRNIRAAAKEEARDMIRTNLGEYVDPEEPPAKWDVAGLARWAARAFHVNLSQNQLKKMTPKEIDELLEQSAERHFETISLDGIERFADENFPRDQFIEWARAKFDLALSRSALVDKSDAEIVEAVVAAVKGSYADREARYPVEAALEHAFRLGEPGSAASADFIIKWAKNKYGVEWTLEAVQRRSPEQVFDDLLALNRRWLNREGLRTEVERATREMSEEQLAAWGAERFRGSFEPERYKAFQGTRQDALVEEGFAFFRQELTRMEQFLLLRVHDQVWMDHLLELDNLESAIRQRPLGGDQTHPQSQFAIEGRELFTEMWKRIDARVTDMIFRIRGYSGEAVRAPAASTTTTSGTDSVSYGHADATGQGFASVAQRQAEAMRAQNVEQKVETIRREQPKVGRNDPCPCGSGKKYKQCCGKVHN